jgi:hypothetical protein
MKTHYQYGKLIILGTVLGLGSFGCRTGANKAQGLPTPTAVGRALPPRPQSRPAEPQPPKPQPPKPTSRKQTPIPIHKSKQGLAVVRARLPRGAKSRFYGKCKIPPYGHGLVLHLYALPANNYVLDVFTTNGYEKRDGDAPPLLHTIPFKYTEFADNPDLRVFDYVEAQVLWLDPRHKTQPVVRLDCRFNNGFYGPFGNNFLFIFAKGLNHKPTIQQFGYQGDHNMYHTVAFDGVDKRGLMMVTVKTQTNNGADNPWNIIDLKWNGKTFRYPNAPQQDY